MNNEKERLTKPFIEHLRERLKTAEDFQGYLDACHEAGPDTFGLAVQDVVEIVRQEARETAFNDCITELCIDCAEGDEPTLDAQARWYYHDAGTAQAVGCAASKLRILFAALEAATTKQPEVKEG